MQSTITALHTVDHEQQQRQMATVLEMHKICGVCGDKALGYNFNALTCESCKAFFRRNALRNKVFRCITAGNCILNAKTRKYCRKCRLDKCFSIGMKKDWILTEEEKLLKRRKHRNRDLERKDADSSSSATLTFYSETDSPPDVPSSNSHHHVGGAGGGQHHQNDHPHQQQQPSQPHHFTNDAQSLTHGNGSLPSHNNSSNNVIIVPFSLPYGAKPGEGVNKENIMNYLKSKLSINMDNAVVNFDALEELNRASQEAETTTTTSGLAPPFQFPQHSIPTFETFKASQIPMYGMETSMTSYTGSVSPRSDQFVSSEYFTLSQEGDAPFYSHHLDTGASTTTAGAASYTAHQPTRQTTMSPQHYQPVIQELHSNSAQMSSRQAQNNSSMASSSAASTSPHTPLDVIKTEESSSCDNAASSSSPSCATTNGGYLWKISDNVYKHAIQLEYTNNPLLSPDVVSEGDSPDGLLRKLTTLEENRLHDINQNLSPLFLYLQCSSTGAPAKVITEIIGGMQYFETLVRKIIIAIKSIQSFKCMCQDDQIVLIKGSVGEIKSLLHIRFFNPQENQCVIPNPEDENSVIIFRNDYLKKAYGEELYGRCLAFFHSFRDDWKFDDSIINLMVMIILFSPHRSNLKHREYITLEYLTYCHLLQRYLEVKYQSVCDGKTVFLNLMGRLEEMHTLNEKCMDLILKLIDPKYQHSFPLTAELFDLDTRQTEPMMTSTATI